MGTRRTGLLCAFSAVAFGAQDLTPDREDQSRRRAEFRAFVERTTPRYREIVREQRSRLAALQAKTLDRERAGDDTACSNQILAEIDWLMGDAMDFKGAAGRLSDLEALAAHPAEEAKARRQDPEDGGWGQCHDAWFFKVNATFDHITNPAYAGERPLYPLRLFDRVNSPERLTRYFDSLSISDIAATGRDNGRELNESLENLGRLILHNRPAYYRWDPKLKDAFMDIITRRLRNPETGWWGRRYVRDGKAQFVDSLSMTYHMVTTLDGKVDDLDKAMAHLLALKDLDYPVGWLRNGRYCNHHLMDVVGLFRYGWPYMREAQRTAAAAEIRKIVRWCLDESLRPDGSFQVAGGDSVEEETNFGASVLDLAGVFEARKRFWTDEAFPEAQEVRSRIVAFIRRNLASGGAGGTYYRKRSKTSVPHPQNEIRAAHNRPGSTGRASATPSGTVSATR